MVLGRLGVILLLCLSFCACDFDGQDKKLNLPAVETIPEGRYAVVSAFRNGRETASLNSGFYEIKKDSVFTNLTKTLDSVATTYTLSKNELNHKNSEVLDFVVADVTQDSIRLFTEMKSFKFELILGKVIPKDEE